MRRQGWERVICCASGPSFDVAQGERVAQARGEGWRVIVVNDAWRRVPSADLHYAMDAPWYELHNASLRSGFAGERWTAVRALNASDYRKAERYDLRYVEGKNRRSLSTEPGVIHFGGNSGFAAINLAYHFGARVIVLVGYDMQNEGGGARDRETGKGGRAHFFGDHPKELKQAANPSDWLPHFDELAPDLERAGVLLLNATRETALRCFQRINLEEALTRCRVLP